MYKLWINL